MKASRVTHNDLVDKLQEMLATATKGVDITATVLLFGVLFNEEIRDSVVGRRRVHLDRRQGYGDPH